MLRFQDNKSGVWWQVTDQADRKGNYLDEESGLSHLSHLATNVLFLMWFEKNKAIDKENEFADYCKIIAESHKNLE